MDEITHVCEITDFVHLVCLYIYIFIYIGLDTYLIVHGDPKTVSTVSYKKNSPWYHNIGLNVVPENCLSEVFHKNCRGVSLLLDHRSVDSDRGVWCWCRG